MSANPGFFYCHLRSGQIKYTLGLEDRGRSNLDRSLELMPTAEAHYLLGMLDKDQGNLNSAMQHFEVAAQSKSGASQAANRELVLLDLQKNPSRYVGSRAAVDDRNRVWIQFGNLTQVPLSNIVFSYAWLDEQGQTRRGQETYAGPLGGGKQDQIRLGFSLTHASELNRRVRVEVISATVSQ